MRKEDACTVWGEGKLDGEGPRDTRSVEKEDDERSSKVAFDANVTCGGGGYIEAASTSNQELSEGGDPKTSPVNGEKTAKRRRLP